MAVLFALQRAYRIAALSFAGLLADLILLAAGDIQHVAAELLLFCGGGTGGVQSALETRGTSVLTHMSTLEQLFTLPFANGNLILGPTLNLAHMSTKLILLLHSDRALHALALDPTGPFRIPATMPALFSSLTAGRTDNFRNLFVTKILLRVIAGQLLHDPFLAFATAIPTDPLTSMPAIQNPLAGLPAI